MTTEPRVVHSDDLEEQEARYPAPFDGEALALGRNLAAASGGERLGAWRDRIPPGRRTSRLHAHLGEEELIYVLSGAPVLEWRAPTGLVRQTPLRAGSYVALPAGTGLAHSLRNPADATEDAVVLVVGERRAGDRLAYPEQPEFEAWRAAAIPERCWNEVDGPDGTGRLPPYRIATERVVLRPLQTRDVWPLVRKVRENLPRLKPWFPWAQKVPSIDDQLAWIRTVRAAYDRDEDYTLGAFTHEGALLGAGGLHLRQGPDGVELGYWIDGPYEGTGRVTEWVAGLTRLALEGMGFDHVVIRTDVNNERSKAIPRRLGFQLERVDRGTCAHGDIDRDIERWVLTRAGLRSSSAATARVRAWDAAGRRVF